MKFASANPRALPNEKNDCVVRALSIAFNKEYMVVHSVCTRAGRRPRRGMYHYQIDRALQILTGDPDAKATSLRMHNAKGNPTFTQFAKDNPKGHFIVSKRGHMVALIDGVYHDAGPIGARCRVVAHYRVK